MEQHSIATVNGLINSINQIHIREKREKLGKNITTWKPNESCQNLIPWEQLRLDQESHGAMVTASQNPVKPGKNV